MTTDRAGSTSRTSHALPPRLPVERERWEGEAAWAGDRLMDIVSIWFDYLCMYVCMLFLTYIYMMINAMIIREALVHLIDHSFTRDYFSFLLPPERAESKVHSAQTLMMYTHKTLTPKPLSVIFYSIYICTKQPRNSIIGSIIASPVCHQVYI